MAEEEELSSAVADAPPVLERVRRLLETPLLPSIGPEVREGVQPARALEEALRIAWSDARLSSRQRDLVRAVVLLWHDHLDAAHTLAQGIGDADGSYVHAIMHRREPDAGNSKYWFRRVGRHATFGPLAGAVTAFLEGRGESGLQRRLVPGGRWDPDAFVDLCEECRGLPTGDGLVGAAVAIQRIELHLLLEHCCGGTGD